MDAAKKSAAWAAYGDALGYVTEFCDTTRLRKRIGVSKISEPVSWKTRVGGRFGAEVLLPAGTYSDDTQLRLCVSRAIRSDGVFDVEAFAKVELPVWRAYALGGGRGTKTAAENLVSDNVNWFSNFFSKNTNYIQAGGNGAAMRVQPHAWASLQGYSYQTMIGEVLRNALCTHGHVNGIFGAVFHAVTLRYALENQGVPSPDIWSDIVEYCKTVCDVAEADRSVAGFWLPNWESRAGKKFRAAVEECADEMHNDIDKIFGGLESPDDLEYKWYARQLNIFDKSVKGSGTKTALASLLLTWLYRRDVTNVGVVVAANELGTDTDTIATMVGALAGSVAEAGPSGDILDYHYIVTEAGRVASRNAEEANEEFQYPDLFGWQPPRTQLDVVEKNQSQIFCRGLGFCTGWGDTIELAERGGNLVQWFKLEFGQHILCKRRNSLRNVDPVGLIGSYQKMPQRAGRKTKGKEATREPSLLDVSGAARSAEGGEARKTAAERRVPNQTAKNESTKNALNDRSQSQEASSSISEMTQVAIDSNFDPKIIGQHILKLSNNEYGVENAIGYSSIIAKAIRSRKKSR